MEMSEKIPKKQKLTPSELNERVATLDKAVNDIFDTDLASAVLEDEIENSGYTYEELGELLHLDRRTVSNYRQNGEYSISTLVRMSLLFDCSVDYLLGLSDCRRIDNHSVSEETGLSDGSIERLKLAHQSVNTHLTWVYDYLIQNCKLVSSLKNYQYLHDIDEYEVDNAYISDEAMPEILGMDGAELLPSDLKMMYKYNAITALFSELDHFAENRSWISKKLF